jgi:hypothetical protein
MIRPLPNQPLASKTFAASHKYSILLQKLNYNLSIWLCMQEIWISKEIQNENSKMKLKINFLSDLRGQIAQCMFIGGLLIY